MQFYFVGCPSNRECNRSWFLSLFVTLSVLLSSFLANSHGFPMGLGDGDQMMDELIAGTEVHDMGSISMTEPVESVETIRKILPGNYNIHEPPKGNAGNITVVNVSVILLNVRDIKELNQELTLEVYLKMSWRDNRLMFPNGVDPEHEIRLSSNGEFMSLNPSALSKIWTPGIFIDHLKRTSQPSLIRKPATFRFFADNTFEYTGRWTLTLACRMDFHYFPADTQECNVDIRSYAHAADKVQLRWHEQGILVTPYELELPNYELGLKQDSRFMTQDSPGHHSTARFTIILVRKLSYHFWQTYLPSTLFIIVSWLSFLIPPESVPGRMGCCMTTLLTVTAMFSAVRQNTPKVSYVKALDIWMVACMIFVFAVLAEYTIVLKLKNMKSWNTGQTGGSLRIVKDIFRLSPRFLPISAWGNTVQVAAYNTAQPTAQIQIVGSKLDKKCSFSITNDRPYAWSTVIIPMSSEKIVSECLQGQVEPADYYANYADQLEYIASMTLPLLFFMFNLLYWSWLL